MNLLFFRSGWVLIGLSLVVILFQIIPTKLADSQWQLTLITALLSNCPTILLGGVFVSYSSRRDDLPSGFLRRAQLLRSVAAWFSLGLLLLLPVQFMASTGIVRNNYFNGMSSMRQLEKVIQDLRGTKTEQEFRERLSKFPDLPPPPPKFDRPYQEVRDIVVETLSSRRAATIIQLAKTRDENLQVVLKESFRNTASLALLAFGFMAISLSDPSQRTVIYSLALLLEKSSVGRLWFAAPKRRSSPAINPSWMDEHPDNPKS